MHKSSYDKMHFFKENYLSVADRLTILDIGSQDVNGSYKDIFNHENWSYVGSDMVSGDNVDIVLKDAYNWKEIDSASLDAVISGQAFEHIEFFWVTMLEIYRVLKPGGVCCLLAPSSGPEHRYPVDCWRFYPDGFFALAKFSQLDVLKVATQWEEQGYEDGSDQWHDSLLVCRKPKFSSYTALKAKVKNRIQHGVLARWLPLGR